MVAAQHGCEIVVDAYMHGGARPDLPRRNAEGDSALILAAKRQHVQVVRYLVKYDSAVEHKNNVGDNALLAAARRGFKGVVKVMLGRDAHANPDVPEVELHCCWPSVMGTATWSCCC
eukprot:TRINITY_DN95970_c0_g1_i1.p2 TRINITY_DN95970_c0_g1~~TRINITY_DN95970_c0_g1_i1.p2  ORF type:complete len:117 (-),score=11.64 TRINITY_DN95970_c0_g1_i1:123-473(-)